MKRSELSHILRAASKIADRDDVIVIGSQSILGSYDEDDLPNRATLSREADVTFWDDEDDFKSDAVDGALGEGSAFDQMYGYYAQGVSVSTAILPEGWKDRMVPFRSSSADPATGWCLEPHDLALSKLAAHREKDYEFVNALLGAGLLAEATLLERLPSMGIPTASRNRIQRWIGFHAKN